MGIPRFYRWLKSKYPLIRMDLSDQSKQLPIFDHFYIDFNALIYQCIRESNCFLRNKIKPLTFEEIYERVWNYLLQMMQVINPRELLYIALDGVAPRAKINQSRDRRFKSAEDDKIFEEVLVKIGVSNDENFVANSISPGTKFLNDMCAGLKERVLKEVETNWSHLKVFFSDCGVPGEGQHKIMDFFRFCQSEKLFHPNTTYCVYSPDADVILLTLSLEVENICLIKEDTSGPMGPNWTATSVYRKAQPKQFQLVMINILREYFIKQFSQILQSIKNSTIQQIIDDMILLMAFVGNDFLPVEFCFTLKDNHIENLFYSYKTYLMENKQFINKRGLIDWENIYKLLEIGRKFEAHMIEEMLMKKRQRHGGFKRGGNGGGGSSLIETVDKSIKKQHQKQQHKGINQQQQEDEQPQSGVNEQQPDEDIENFQIVDNKIIKGRHQYYSSRFGIGDIDKDPKYLQIINSYIEGLQFYCQYYFKGLPSWSWYYPYHYTPMLNDVYEYLQKNKVNIRFEPTQPYDPFLALMFMMPLKSIKLLPNALHGVMLDEDGPLRKPVDYFPEKFQLDKFETLQYNKRALIEFLDEKQVREIYESVGRNQYTEEESKRNELRKAEIIRKDVKTGKGQSEVADITVKETAQQIKKLFKEQNKTKTEKTRFPSLSIWGKDFSLQDGKIVTSHKYKYGGNPGEVVFFNNFLGMIEDMNNEPQELKQSIERQYERYGIKGKCSFIYAIKRVNYVRQINRFALVPTNKQVLVPDFAVCTPPKYDYLKQTQMKPFEEQYKKGDTIVVLNSTYFGYQGIIQSIDGKTSKVKLTTPPIVTTEKIEEYETDFFTVDFVCNKLNIKQETLMSIMQEITILPQFKRKDPFTESLPTAINFSLNLIDSKIGRLVPRFVRCQMEYENTYKPSQIFRKMEISALCLEYLELYMREFDWLVECIENMIEKGRYVFRKPLYARELFADYDEPNLKMYQEFIKLYKFSNEGSFSSIYSKTYQRIPAFKQSPVIQKQITVANNQMISREQARLCPPALKYEPEYHNIGDRVVLLRTLETGYITGIDDNVIHVKVGLGQKSYRVRFHEIFNENWTGFLAVEEGKTWNLEVSYYSPSYWRKAIDIEKQDSNWEDMSADEAMEI